MTAELTPYQSRTEIAPQRSKSELDSWVHAMGDIARLSEYIAETEFVPDAMRGRPAAVAAAILTGREMGLEPMTALRGIHVIKGKPGLSAELMRAQVLAAGHLIEYVETTDTRCVVKGKRRGEQEWTTVSFTSQQAHKAKIDLGGYPEDKLVARATTRLCRRKFSDVVAGLASVDELEDGERAQPAETTEQPQRRTAQRKRSTLASDVPAAAPEPQPAPAEQQPTPAGPPLPGEDGYDEPSGEATEQDEAAPEEITAAQQKKLGVLMRAHGITDRDTALGLVANIIGRTVGSRKELTKAEASWVIDALDQDEQAQTAQYEAEQDAADEAATAEGAS